jgi:hypothetical protein
LSVDQKFASETEEGDPPLVYFKFKYTCSLEPIGIILFVKISSTIFSWRFQLFEVQLHLLVSTQRTRGLVVFGWCCPFQTKLPCHNCRDPHILSGHMTLDFPYD